MAKAILGKRQIWLVIASSLLFTSLANNLAGAADDVVVASAGEGEAREAALRRLREEGPAGLAKLLQYYGDFDKRSSASPDSPVKARELALIDRAIDQVGGALGSRASGLFWHTDMAKAQAAAKDSGKPILALFMLGKLTDEYSCANSRFFRSTLYANRQVSDFLRANFTLVWQTVRPAPRITIDFGDGRKLERTITGNSIHYIVTADGWVMDALPGLYGPTAFMNRLKTAQPTAKLVESLPPYQRAQALGTYHLGELRETARKWTEELDSIDSSAANTVAANVEPVAAAAQQRCPSLAPPDFVSLNLEQLNAVFSGLELRTTELYWEQLSQRHWSESQVDDASRAYIASERPIAAQAGRLAITKSVVENPLLRLVRNLQHSIARDTVRNEYQLHRKLHAMLAHTPTMAANLGQLNEIVYADLFLMPTSDPWLGLAPPDVYTGLTDNGVVRVNK